MSFNQPGPYGQPPQPPQGPNPYGQPGYGYPQQPPAPAPAYGQQPPPPPYGAPQQPAPGGWGQPQPTPGAWGQQPGVPGQYPPPVPPQGGGKGKAIGITIGALVVVGALVGGAMFFLNGGSDGDVKPYTMVMPETLLEGKFTKTPTPAGTQNKPQSLADNEKAKAAGIENGTSVNQSYTNAEKQVLSVGGTYGTIADPEKSLDTVISLGDEQQKKLLGSMNAKVETIAPWAEFSPSGFDGAVMKCRTQKIISSFGNISSETETTTCAWSDTSAIGSVSHQISKSNSPYGAAAGAATGTVMSAKDLSEATVKVRNEVRKEK
ncbi:hypothetical protein LE181_22870 [Streptomyces sp. SCA3-4]|uniref:hypothetical protein n=1 Tax=Streptomyces sichuanensis TaxID=2871810 RepID=UPI001CE308B0|nr:hypothetical protein [Streptomyces sichuanensis]MCA6095003.1 hypothetical protein [Streptomyces sichuanensis]